MANLTGRATSLSSTECVDKARKAEQRGILSPMTVYRRAKLSLDLTIAYPSRPPYPYPS